jgi:hypothetical protein
MNEHDLQTLRLMLMMYRQGWLDATEHIRGQTMRIDREIKALYRELQ